MFCPKCGKQVDECDAFCRSCGHTLSTNKPPSTVRKGSKPHIEVVMGLLLVLAAVVWWQFLGPWAKLRELRRASDAVVAACVQGDQTVLDRRTREFDLAKHAVDSAELVLSETALENRLIQLGCRGGEIGSPQATEHAAKLALDALETACLDRRSSEITRRTEEAGQVISKLRGKELDFWMRELKEWVALCPEMPSLKERQRLQSRDSPKPNELGGFDGALMQGEKDAQQAKGPVHRGGPGQKKYYAVFLAYPEMLGDAEVIKQWRSNLETRTCLRVVQKPEDADFQIVFSDKAHYAFADKEGNALYESGIGTTETRQYAELNQWAGCAMKTPFPERSHATAILAGGTDSKGRGTEERVEPNAGTQARGYKDEDGMYRARREDDAETQRQFDLINEDLIVYVPMCGSADSALKIEIDKSLRLDEYELSRLIGRDEAKAFHNRVSGEGCL